MICLFAGLQSDSVMLAVVQFIVPLSLSIVVNFQTSTSKIMVAGIVVSPHMQ